MNIPDINSKIRITWLPHNPDIVDKNPHIGSVGTVVVVSCNDFHLQTSSSILVIRCDCKWEYI